MEETVTDYHHHQTRSDFISNDIWPSFNVLKINEGENMNHNNNQRDDNIIIGITGTQFNPWSNIKNGFLFVLTLYEKEINSFPEGIWSSINFNRNDFDTLL